MLEFSFWLLFISIPLVVFYLLKIAGEKINQVSVVNVVVIALYLFSVLGTLPMFYLWDDYRVAIGITDQNIVLRVLFYSCVNLLFFLVGVIFARTFLGIRPLPFNSGKINSLSKRQLCVLMGLSLLCFAVLIVYLKKIGQIALVTALTEGPRAAEAARSAMGNGFQGKYHWYHLIMHELGNLITFTAYAIFLRRKTYKNLFMFMLAWGYSVFVAVMATEKSPFAWLMVGLFMIHYLVKNSGFIPFRKILYFGTSLVGALSVFYIFFMGSIDVGSAISSVFSRAFSGSISPAYFYLQYFPTYQEYLLGQSFPNPGQVMPYDSINYTVDMMNWVFPYHIEEGIVGSMPTVFWGEAYANFGPWSIAPIAFIMGLIVAGVSYLISKVEVSPLTVGFLVWLSLHLKNLSVSDFSGFIYDFYMILISFFILVILLSRMSIGLRRLQRT